MQPDLSEQEWQTVAGRGKAEVEEDFREYKDMMDDCEIAQEEAEIIYQHGRVHLYRDGYHFDLCEPPRLTDYRLTQRRQLHPIEKARRDEAWLPLARFLEKLTGLTDVVYSCTNAFPACLLSALHAHHPRTRLHLHTFSLPSLVRAPGALDPLDADDLALATSPCLFSLVLATRRLLLGDHDDTGGGYLHNVRDLVDYNLDMVAQMLAGLAPNLAR
ncbi:hypothetical protein Micbo1qcDRAFT_166166, partial [Microdochium bolleyi]